MKNPQTVTQKVVAYNRASADIDECLRDLGDYFLRYYDPEIFDGTTKTLVKKVDRAYARFERARKELGA